MSATAGAAGVACSSSDSNGGNGNPDSGTGDGGGDGAASGNYALEVPCGDTIDSVYADPGTLPSDKGAIIRCAKDKDISKADLEAAAKKPDLTADGGVDTPGYNGKPFTSGAHVYRILYRTERGDPANSAGYSSALVLIPDNPRAPKSPIVVASHGSRGQASKCAPSKNDPAASDVEGDFVRQVFTLAGAGYAVIAPDLAGYANYGGASNPPSAYAAAADVGKSTLDGARALKKMIGSSLLDKVVLVGHSQGGGTALGALAISASYASELSIAAVAVYSPLWVSLRTTAAVLLEPASYGSDQSAIPKVAAWYYYTHGELLDGPGHGVDVFAPSLRSAVKSFIDNDCWAAPDLATLGANDAGVVTENDYLDPQFAKDIKNVAAGVPAGVDCSSASDPARCQKWMDRFIADWPHITGALTQIPILSLYGGQDTTITPDIAACVFRRYKSDNLNYKVCVDPNASHSGIVALQSSYVADWIAAKTLGGADPGACPADESAVTTPCNSLVPEN